MESLFECSFRTTKANVQEYARYFHFRTPRFLIVLLIILGYLAWAVSLIVRYGWRAPYIFLLLFALVLYPGLTLYRHNKSVNTILARSRELHNGKEAVSQTVFYENELMIIDHGENRYPFAYDNLKKVVVTKNLLLLQSKARQSVLCEKASFTKGEWTDCVAFLKEKGLKIKNS